MPDTHRITSLLLYLVTVTVGASVCVAITTQIRISQLPSQVGSPHLFLPDD